MNMNAELKVAPKRILLDKSFKKNLLYLMLDDIQKNLIHIRILIVVDSIKVGWKCHGNHIIIVTKRGT